MKTIRPSRAKHEARLTEEIAHEAALFIRGEAGNASLITVTRAIRPARSEQITVFVSVFPEEQGRAAIDFLSRKREAFSEYLKKHARLGPLPRIDFMLDDRS